MVYWWKSSENRNSSIKATATEAVQPKPNPINVGTLAKSGEYGSSSTQLTNPEATHEHKTSFGQRYVAQSEDAKDTLFLVPITLAGGVVITIPYDLFTKPS